MHDLNKGAVVDPGALHVFCPLIKVDVAKREVWGVVTAEVPDKEGEICDFDTTIPYYKAMVDEMSKATDGVNIFPLREMHGLSAAGKGIDIQFREGTKEVYMGFKVVDDAAWNKVAEGVYTGFSQGGRYVKKWKDGEYTKYTAKPSEVSLVDVPCLTRAHFDYVKADGVVEKRAFKKTGGEIPTEVGALPNSPTAIAPLSTPEIAAAASGGGVPSSAICSCPCPECKAGDCSACSMGEKCANCQGAKVAKFNKAVKYLVEKDGEKHLPYTKEDGKPDHRLMGAAWAALHGGYRGNKYDGPDKAKAIKKLKQLYAQEGLDTPSEKSVRAEEMIKSILTDVINNRAFGQLGKGMYTVSFFSDIVEQLKYLWMALEYERDEEGDESPVTDELKEIFERLLEALLTYTEEQIEEEKEKHLAQTYR